MIARLLCATALSLGLPGQISGWTNLQGACGPLDMSIVLPVPNGNFAFLLTATNPVGAFEGIPIMVLGLSTATGTPAGLPLPCGCGELFPSLDLVVVGTPGAPTFQLPITSPAGSTGTQIWVQGFDLFSPNATCTSFGLPLVVSNGGVVTL